MRLRDVHHRLNDVPFKPFKIHLSDESSIPVRDAGTMILGRSSAVIPTEFDKDAEGFRFAKHWWTVALAHMVEFTDIDPPKSASRRKRVS